MLPRRRPGRICGNPDDIEPPGQAEGGGARRVRTSNTADLARHARCVGRRLPLLRSPARGANARRARGRGGLGCEGCRDGRASVVSTGQRGERERLRAAREPDTGDQRGGWAAAIELQMRAGMPGPSWRAIHDVYESRAHGVRIYPWSGTYWFL